MNHICIKEVPDRKFTVGKIYEEGYYLTGERWIEDDDRWLIDLFLPSWCNSESSKVIHIDGSAYSYSEYFENALIHIRNKNIETILK